MKLQQIGMRELFEKKLGANEVILDVRAPEEFVEGHVQGSLNIPHDVLATRLSELRNYEKIYIHCRSGKRAELAAQVLTSAGMQNLICVVGSGMPDWIAAGFPFEKGLK